VVCYVCDKGLLVAITRAYRTVKCVAVITRTEYNKKDLGLCLLFQQQDLVVSLRCYPCLRSALKYFSRLKSGWENLTVIAEHCSKT